MASLAGSFLVARPSLQDPNFRQTVVLMLQHDPEGAYGLVVNRAGKSKGLPFPLFNGGPCKAEGLIMVHGHADWPGGDEKGVAPGVYLGDAACLKRVSDAEIDEVLRYRVFKGYAGWGPGQLEGELVAGAWAVVPATAEILFDVPVDDLWVSVAPPRIPQPSQN